MAKSISAKWPDFTQNATILQTVAQDLEAIKDRTCTADISQKNCAHDKELVDTIKASIEKLLEAALLSAKIVAMHKDNIQEMYDELANGRN